MSRMENREVMGFFAIDPKHHTAITSLVAPATHAHKLLDPYAGMDGLPVAGGTSGDARPQGTRRRWTGCAGS